MCLLLEKELVGLWALLKERNTVKRSYIVELLSGGNIKEELYNTFEVSMVLILSCFYKKLEVQQIKRCSFCD